jgi:hypothetical protein
VGIRDLERWPDQAVTTDDGNLPDLAILPDLAKPVDLKKPAPDTAPCCSVVSFALVNADTDNKVVSPLVNGTISLGKIGATSINIVANTSPSTVGCVDIFINSFLARTEGGQPYSLGDVPRESGLTDFLPWKYDYLIKYTVKAVPYQSCTFNPTTKSVMGQPLQIDVTFTP